jgi:hypothetical protein
MTANVNVKKIMQNAKYILSKLPYKKSNSKSISNKVSLAASKLLRSPLSCFNDEKLTELKEIV